VILSGYPSDILGLSWEKKQWQAFEMAACTGMFFETPSATIPLVVWWPASKEADFMEF